MTHRFAPLAETRATIASFLVDDAQSIPAHLGAITLRSHQRAAATRLLSLVGANGGALLAEPVGVGKTFTALAVAAALRQKTLIAIPAALRSMWTDALAQTGLSATVLTHEAFSRGATPMPFDGLVIVDEAHRLRNPSTRRYAALAEQCRRAKVLLVTATPVHNHRSDLAAQLALFLGRVVWQMNDEDLARHVVREAAQNDSAQPRINGPHRVSLSVDDDCLDAILALPPPIPARDEALAAALLTYGLVHQWTSSRAALSASLSRRRARGVALLAAVEAGRRPSRDEMNAWTHAEGAVQLAFPELITAPPSNDDLPMATLAESLRGYDAAVAALLARLRTANDPDRARANALRRIRLDHPHERIIAFCQYTETVNALRSSLAADPGVAALTARGARVAGGRVSRDDVIAQFTPRAPSAPPIKQSERIDLLITTDLLSEGLNLQEASVIVHLDLPWNPARLDQRVGRARRLGSRHEVVSVYIIAPPASAERMLRIEERLRDKLCVAQRTVGVAGRILPSPLGSVSPPKPALAEQLGAARAELMQWVGPTKPFDGGPVVAAVAADSRGFLALIRDAEGVRLVADVGAGIEHCAAAITSAVLACNGIEARVAEADAECALLELKRWLLGRSAAISIDLHSATAARSRRTALARVARALARAPRHQRARLAPLAAVARFVATAPMPEGAERVLQLLVESELPDEAWLRSIAAFGELNTRPRKESPNRSAVPEVIALILLKPDSLE